MSSATWPTLECRTVSAGYLGLRVLHDVSFVVREPAIYVVLGPNGAGKTTLLRTLAGILQPDHGEVLIDGGSTSRPPARDSVHYLSHADGIPDGLRVREALEFYARVEGGSSVDVDRVLDLLEIRDLADRFAAQLSAGQRKRVAVARIFLQERGIYLLDEPTSNLDPKVAREIRNLILGLSKQRIVLYSSHNLYEAREIGQFVIAIKDGRVALFDRIDNIRSAKYIVGIRALEPSPALDAFPAQGEYRVKELRGPEEVPTLVRELENAGVRIREIREMGNPLEDLFV